MKSEFEVWFSDKFGKRHIDYEDKITAALYEAWTDGYFIGWSAASS